MQLLFSYVQSAFFTINYYDFIYTHFIYGLLQNYCKESDSVLTTEEGGVLKSVFWQQDILHNTSQIDVVNADDYSFAEVRATQLFGATLIKKLSKKTQMIRFTPGYLRFFRKFRAQASQVFSFYYIRQHQFTAFINKLRRLSGNILVTFFELSLFCCVKRCRFFFNDRNIRLIILSGLFFINGRVCYDCNFQLQCNDILQTCVSYAIYNFFIAQNMRYAASLSKFLGFFLNKKILRSNLEIEDSEQEDGTRAELNTMRAHIEKQNSKKSEFTAVNSCTKIGRDRFIFWKYNIHTISVLYNYLLDVPAYIELDFFTLSAVILTSNYKVSDADIQFLFRSGALYTRMLN